MKTLQNAISGNTILNRLLVCFLVSTLFPTILITVLLCLRFDRNYRSTAEAQIAISQNLIKAYLNSYCDDIDTVTSAPYYHSYFSSRKSFDPQDENYLTELSKFQSEMRNLINLTTLSHSDIRDLVFFSDGALLYYPFFYNEYRYFRNNMTLEEQPWYRHALEGDGSTVFTPDRETNTGDNSILDVTTYYITRKIRNVRQPDQINIILLNLQSREFETRLKSIDLLYDSFVVITNEKGELIYSSRPLTNRAFEQIRTGQQFRYEGSLWNCLANSTENMQLNATIVFSLDEIGQHTRSTIYSAAGIYLICMIAALILFYSFNRWIVNSTGALQSTFEELEGGNLDARCPNVEVKEFNEIGSSINDVIDKLNEKIKKEYLMTLQQKSLQLSALQSQIQPHFLINTIYCFIALNQIGETKKLNDGFYSLAHLLRYVLKKQSITTIGQECDFLEDYLKLQQLRFSERLTYTIDCPEECRNIRIPRLILQPLAENAVIHGIEPCEHPCLCQIRIEQEEEVLKILVEDNGVGFDAEAMERKLSDPALSDSASTSVGLPYVKSCLLLWYPDAELRIRCDQTTRIEILIPRSELNDENSDR